MTGRNIKNLLRIKQFDFSVNAALLIVSLKVAETPGIAVLPLGRFKFFFETAEKFIPG